MAAVAPALAMTVPASAQISADLSSELDQAVSAYNRATVSNDTTTLAELVTDDYMLVNSDTTLQDKRSYLSDFEVPEFRVDPYVIEQPFQRIWGEAALTGGLFRLGWTQGGRHQSRRLRVAHVWTRQEGRWQIVYSQLTRVPEQS